MYTVDEQPECALRKLTWSWKLKRATIHARIIICLAAKSYFLRPEITPRSIISGKPLSSFKRSKHYRSSVTALLTSDCNQFFNTQIAVWCKQEDGEAMWSRSNQAGLIQPSSHVPQGIIRTLAQLSLAGLSFEQISVCFSWPPFRNEASKRLMHHSDIFVDIIDIYVEYNNEDNTCIFQYKCNPFLP